jgi:ClpP class serine protease
VIDLLALLVQDPGAAAQPPPPVAAAPAAGGSSAFWDGLMGQLPFLLFFLIFLIPGILRSRAAADFERRVEQTFARLQKKRRSRMIALVHREETMGFLNIPQLRYIDLNDAEDILEAIRRTPPNQPLELILHTPGGLVLPALQIARAVKAHKGKKTVFVPHYAMSGGTLIALAADEIVLNTHAVLGPIDPQIGGLPAASILRVAQTKSADAVDDYTLVLADLSQKAIDQLEAAAKELLAGTVSPNAAANIAQLLSSGRWTHDYPIEAGEAREIGLNVSTDFPNDIAELMTLFPNQIRRTRARWFDTARALVAPPKRKATVEGTPFTGYQPGPGARSFSYGPWDSRDLRPRGDPGPDFRDLREDRSIRRR